MRICYLLQGRDNPELALQYALALSKQAVVVLTLNDEKWRNDAYYILVKNKNILLSTSTPFAQEGDLSSARCWLYQMKDALDKFDFDLCVNLSENVLPLTTHQEWIDMLETSMTKNALSFEKDTTTDPQLSATMKRYFFSTNSQRFAGSEKVRKRARITADLVYALGFRRKFKDVVYEGEPWFVFDRNTVMNYCEHISYLTENFLLGWYPERVIFQTMWKKYLHHKEIDNVCFVEPFNKDQKAYFKRYEKLTDRKEMAAILHAFEPSYEAPYEFVAEEIVEEDNRSYLQKTIDSYKKKK